VTRGRAGEPYLRRRFRVMIAAWSADQLERIATTLLLVPELAADS